MNTNTILNADETESKPFSGVRGEKHILITPTEDNDWASGDVEIQILNPHEEAEHWRTIEVISEDDYVPDAADDNPAVLHPAYFIFGLVYRLKVDTAGVVASLWHYEGD